MVIFKFNDIFFTYKLFRILFRKIASSEQHDRFKYMLRENSILGNVQNTVNILINAHALINATPQFGLEKMASFCFTIF